MRSVRLLAILTAVVAAACGAATPLDSGAGSPGGGGAGGSSVVAQGQGQAPYAYFYAGDPAGTGKIYAVPAGGGAPVLLVVGSAGDQIGFALSFDDTNLYYGNYQESAGAIGARSSLVMHPIYAGAPVDLVEGVDQFRAIATDDQNVYFMVFNGSTNLTGFIGSVPKTGGAVQPLVELAVSEIGNGLTVGGGFVYWTQTDGAVRRVPVLGGNPETLASGELNPGEIAVVGSDVYWLSAGTQQTDCTPLDGAVRHLTPGAGAPTTVAAKLAGVTSLAVGGGDVFWSTSGPMCAPTVASRSGTVFELRAKDSSPRVLASNLTYPSDLVSAGGTLYLMAYASADSLDPAPMAISPH